jgi:hypothetical protein
MVVRRSRDCNNTDDRSGKTGHSILYGISGADSSGGSAVLQWSVSGANTITIDNGIGNVNASGTRAVSPLQSTVYTLTAVNQGGSTTATAAVTMVQPTATGNPVIQFTATHLGGTSWRLNWQVTNATQAVIEPEIGSVNFTGSTTVTSPSGQLKTYRLTAHNSWGGWAYHEVILGSP